MTSSSIEKREGSEAYRITVWNSINNEEMYISILPHADKMAKGFQLQSNGNSFSPPRVVVLSQNPTKDIADWSVGDEVLISF